MAKIGDTVRFLNTTGGGVITRIDGKIAYVEENGFETPVLLKDVVVVLPAGHEPKHKGSIMFDQQAFDRGKEQPVVPKVEKIEQKEEEEELPIEETSHGDKLNLVLAFEPKDVKNLSGTWFNVVLVNDSNYFLDFVFLRKGSDIGGWMMEFHGSVAPNELIDLAKLRHETLGDFEKIAVQYIAYKKDKPFDLQSPANITRKLDLTKFHKLHCFRPGTYFDTPVMELTLVKDGIPYRPMDVDARAIEQSMQESRQTKESLKELAAKYNTGSHKGKKQENPERNPHKLLPLIEVDLHIAELIDNTVGMEPKDMLEKQLDTVRKHMKAHSRRIGQKLVFIHGKGEGVLRKAVLELLKKEFPKAETQDASFREYGFGATLVTIH